MRLYIVGAGGFGREVLEYAQDLAAAGAGLEVVGFLDDDPSALKGRTLEVGVVGRPEVLAGGKPSHYVLAVGDPLRRRELARRCDAAGLQPARVVHPTAYVARTADVAAGAVVCPFAFVAPHSRLEPHVVLNTYASIGHDARIGASSVLSPYATVNGGACVEEACFLGSHATVLPRVSVGKGTKVAAGSVVTRDVEAFSLATGNPASSRVMFPHWP